MKETQISFLWWRIFCCFAGVWLAMRNAESPLIIQIYVAAVLFWSIGEKRSYLEEFAYLGMIILAANIAVGTPYWTVKVAAIAIAVILPCSVIIPLLVKSSVRKFAKRLESTGRATGKWANKWFSRWVK